MYGPIGKSGVPSIVQNIFPDSLYFVFVMACLGLVLIVLLSAMLYLGSGKSRNFGHRTQSAQAIAQGSERTQRVTVPVPVDLGTKRFLSNAESAFFWTLKKAIADQYVIAMKVPLSDVFQRRSHLEKDLFSMLENGHVDFLLLHPRSWEPVAGIELDDSTHATPAGRERGLRKDKLFVQARLPLKRFRVGEQWTVASIQQWVSNVGRGLNDEPTASDTLSPSPATDASRNLTMTIEKLARLRDSGTITEDQFQETKNRLLGRI